MDKYINADRVKESVQSLVNMFVLEMRNIYQ